MLQHFHGIKKLPDLVAAQHDRQAMGLTAGRHDLLDVPLPPQRDLEEKAQRGDRDQDRAGRQLPLLGEMDLVAPDVGRTQQLGRFAEVASEQRDLLDVGTLGVRCEVADPHVLDHALAKRRHGQLLCGMERAKRRTPSSRSQSHQTKRTDVDGKIAEITLDRRIANLHQSFKLKSCDKIYSNVCLSFWRFLFY